MLKIITASLVALSALQVAYASTLSWEYKDWSSSNKPDRFYRTLTHGSVVHGHQLGVIINKATCNAPNLWLSWSTSNEKLLAVGDTPVKITISAGGYDESINTPFLSTFKMTDTLYVGVISNIKLSDGLVNAFKKGDNATVSITHSTDSDLFDIRKDTFSLSGFTANQTKIIEWCQANSPKLEIEETQIAIGSEYGVKLDSIIEARRDLLTSAYTLEQCYSLHESSRDNRWLATSLYKMLAKESVTPEFDGINHRDIEMLADSHYNSSRVAGARSLKYCPHSLLIKELIDPKKEKANTVSVSECSRKYDDYSSEEITMMINYQAVIAARNKVLLTASNQQFIESLLSKAKLAEQRQGEAIRFLNENCDGSSFRLYNTATKKVINH